MSKYGQKYICSACGCKFYDLNRANPVCPKCGVVPKKLTGKQLAFVEVSKSPLKSEPGETGLINSTESELEFDESLWDNIDELDEDVDQ
ncbi:FYDLN acid domain-containing protein [bacterium]|nr:FYDLN acid domain-containing protein [bacterium]